MYFHNIFTLMMETKHVPEMLVLISVMKGLTERYTRENRFYCYYATSRKVTGSRPDDMFEFFKSIESFRPQFFFFLTEMSIRRRKMFLGSRARPAHSVDNLTANCEPIV
jgi:hypothetical protein